MALLAWSARLRQRNRLAERGERIGTAEASFEKIEAEYRAARARADAASEATRAARAALESADEAAAESRRIHAGLAHEFAARVARHENLGETRARIVADISDIDTRFDDGTHAYETSVRNSSQPRRD